MLNEKRMKTCYVDIYCKIYAEGFPTFYRENATGEDITNFLLSDCRHSFEDEDVLVPGDLIIWYLATNEKVGHMIVDGMSIEWGWGESSWDKVKRFVNHLRDCEIINHNQQSRLINAICEGESNFSFMYDITPYLVSKRDGKDWKHPGNEGREHSKEFFSHVKKSFEGEGFTFHEPDEY